MQAYLIRTYHKDHTAGIFVLSDGNKIVFTCNTIELPNLGNQRRISCIPEGKYKVVPYSSQKFPNVYEIKDVPNRTAILIHAANTTKDILGCIGVGDFSKLGEIVNSRKTLSKLKKATKEFTLHIWSVEK